MPQTTQEPTLSPTPSPTEVPTPSPTHVPTEVPSPSPTHAPTEVPTPSPTLVPTEEPTPEPTEEPTVQPTEEPTVEPTAEPTPVPTSVPTPLPSVEPTEEPTYVPTVEPTPAPTELPTVEPTEAPTGCLVRAAKMHVLFKSNMVTRRLLMAIQYQSFQAVEDTLHQAVAAELNIPLDKLKVHSTESTSGEIHVQFLFKGLEAITHGYELEKAVLANQFNPLPDYPIHRLYMEEVFNCGAHAVGATHPYDGTNDNGVKFSLPDSGWHIPTHPPSVEPTAVPTTTPTEFPTPSPTQTPTEVPTTLAPTTTEPSFRPSHTPTERPTPVPTTTPTEVPTSAPLMPSVEVGGWRSTGTGGLDGWTNFNMVFPQTMYRFNSAGQVCSWKMHKSRSSSVKLQVWRGSGSTYTLVGENNIATTSTGSAYTYNVPSSQRITVQAGDYIGLRFSSPATIPFTNGGSVYWGSGPGHRDVPVGSAYSFPGHGGRQYAVTATLCGSSLPEPSLPSHIQVVGNFKCDTTKRFVSGAPYRQWSSFTTQGGEAARQLCRDHFTAAQKPHGWWFQFYSNGHFNCATFTTAVDPNSANWENTHGRPEEVCIPR